MKDSHSTIRRRMVQAIALAVALSAGSAMAQAWPTRPVTLVVPFAAGGTVHIPYKGSGPIASCWAAR